MVLLAISLLAACDPPPAWRPGDPPLKVWAPEPAVWAAAQRACAAWSMTGLTCVREPRADDADVMVEAGELDDLARTYSDRDPVYWRFSIVIRRDQMTAPRIDGIVTHEFGHLLGFWPGADGLDETGHLPWGTYAIMEPGGGPDAMVTSIDLDHLAIIWGEAPWER